MPFSSPISRGRPSLAGVAAKRLVAVDLPDHGSNQHELNGVNQLVLILGDERIERGLIRWLLISDDEGIATDSTGSFTWYDSRENKPHRSAEFRLYYDSENQLENADPGDIILLAAIVHDPPPQLVAFVIPRGSSFEQQLCWLFGLDPDLLKSFSIPDPELLTVRARSVAALDLVELLGLSAESKETPATDLDLVRRRFGGVFPSTAEMSAFARYEAPHRPRTDPDAALHGWLQREEQLFRALEEFLVRDRLETGFAGIDDFISFSLSVHNRRKARMGRALENHLRAVFDENGIEYSYNAVTEHNSRPDFLFPSVEAYQINANNGDGLYMLGAKSTCKDRWRQVLAEAARIPHKHLCTLEPKISESQTDEMNAAQVSLVVPAEIRDTYTEAQKAEILTISGFLDLVS